MSKINKILVPTDFSENSFNVFKHVQKTAVKNEATVDLINVFTETNDDLFYKENFGDKMNHKDAKELKEALSQKLNAVMEKYIPKENRGKSFIVKDIKTTRGINNFAKSKDYDLIMISSHGLGDSIFTLGSVTEKLIRVSHIPVLSTHQKYDTDITNVLLTTDGSKTSFEAFPLAFHFAQMNNANMNLFSVINLGFSNTGAGERILEYALEHLQNDILQSLTAYIEHSNEYEFVGKPSIEKSVVKKKNGKRKVEIHTIIESGVSTHKSIANYASENAELAVIATHGYSGLKHLFLGSVAGKLIQELTIPILTIKPDSIKEN